MGARLKLKGETFGKLKVLNFAYMHNGNSYFVCQCQCGKITEVSGNNLRRRHTISCGHARKLSRPRERKRTPDYTRTWQAWYKMISRCIDWKSQSYYNYGGRGISVCNRWEEDFRNFLGDMGICPNGLTLDRIDNNGNYEPGNCRWATRKEQQNNTRRNLYGTYNGRKLSLAQFVEKVALKEDYTTIHNLIKRKGMNFEEALQSFKERRAP